MQGRSLDVQHVLFAVDPRAAHAEFALELASGLSAHGLKTTLACVSPPTRAFLAKARRIPGADIRFAPAGTEKQGGQEWLVFLESLGKPDLVQLFAPEHVFLPWRSPTVLTLIEPKHERLHDAILAADLLAVASERTLQELRFHMPDCPYAAVIPNDEHLGRNYLLAYQETVQAASVELGPQLAGCFELI